MNPLVRSQRLRRRQYMTTAADFASQPQVARPAYARTVLQHEAGHFLVAYLLGCPIEACLLGGWQGMRDARFAGTAAR